MYGEPYTREDIAFAKDITRQRRSEGLNQKEIALHIYQAEWFPGRTIRSLEDLVSRCAKEICREDRID